MKVEVAYDGAAKSGAAHLRFRRAEVSMRLPYIFAAPAFAVVLLAWPHAARAQSKPIGTDADFAAIKQTCADFSESFSRHDAQGVAMTFAEDADFTNMSGRHSHGRADIETWFAGLFRGNLKDALRTDTVRSTRYFTPELAEVEAETVITGTHGPDGLEIPPRKGLMIVLMIKENGHWLIGTFHEAEYPAPRGGSATVPSNNSAK